LLAVVSHSVVQLLFESIQREGNIMITYRKFWLVWCTNHPVNSAKKRHFAKCDAAAEAARLALQSPGKQFVVLEAVQCEEIQITKHRVVSHFDYFSFNELIK
jgi:hypothetical protein